MSASQRVSRGFHRLGLALAIIVLLTGVAYWVVSAMEVAGYDWRHHKDLVCANEFLQKDEKRFWDLSLIKPANPDDALIDMKALGCETAVGSIVKFREVKIVPPFTWVYAFASNLLFPPILISALATLILALAVYGLVRAIGWVIGGFAAS